LSDLGVSVDLAVSTAEGVARFRRGKYDCVISDMGREEGGAFRGDAGLVLLREIRALSADVPFVIFSSSRAVREQGKQALAAGATGITSSQTELSGLLHIGADEPGA